jgi:hypothetical protein
MPSLRKNPRIFRKEALPAAKTNCLLLADFPEAVEITKQEAGIKYREVVRSGAIGIAI